MSHETTRSPVTPVKTIRNVYQGRSYGKKGNKEKIQTWRFPTRRRATLSPIFSHGRRLICCICRVEYFSNFKQKTFAGKLCYRAKSRCTALVNVSRVFFLRQLPAFTRFGNSQRATQRKWIGFNRLFSKSFFHHAKAVETGNSLPLKLKSLFLSAMKLLLFIYQRLPGD